MGKDMPTAGGKGPKPPPTMETGGPTPVYSVRARDQQDHVGSLGSFLEMQCLGPRPEMAFRSLHLNKNVHATCVRLELETC